MRWKNVLERELARRSTINPRYSLRAFARDLELAPSALSYLLRGRRNPSRSTINRLVKKIGLDLKEVQRPGGIYRKGEVLILGERSTQLLDDWWRVAIYESLGTAGGNSSSQIASKLGLRPALVKTTLRELEASGWVESGNGQYHKRADRLGAYSNTPHHTLREYHKQLFRRAITDLEESEPSDRVVGSLTLPVDGDAVGQVQELWNEFILRVEEILSSSKSTKAEVATAIFSFFPARQGVRKRNKKGGT